MSSEELRGKDEEETIKTGPMRITEIRISLRDDNKLRAFASITFENCFVIRGIKVIEGLKRPFVAMPSRRRSDGTYQDVAHPVNNETREWIEGEILRKFEEERKAREENAESEIRSEAKSTSP